MTTPEEKQAGALGRQPRVPAANAKTSRRVRWFIGTALIIALLIISFAYPLPLLFYPDLPSVPFFKRALCAILLCGLFCLFRLFRGPTAPDRVVSLDIFGTLIVGVCAILSIPTGRTWYIDIAIVWALQSFIGSLALAKYLESRDFDE